MAHPLVLALFQDRAAAAGAAEAVRAIGVDREHLSIVARTHEEEGQLARELGGTPGVEIEDSRPAARLGELGGHILAAIALVMPGIGPTVMGGPLAAELGEAAGHAAGGIVEILQRAGIARHRAEDLERYVRHGALLFGVHAIALDVETVRVTLERSGALQIEIAHWE